MKSNISYLEYYHLVFYFPIHCILLLYSPVVTKTYLITLMFKCSIRVLPLPVSALFQYNSVNHTHNTRISKFIHTPIGRSEATYRTFSYRGAHI